MWYKFKMLAFSRGVHPAQPLHDRNPANVGRLETARKNAENRFNCLPITHNSFHLFVKRMFCEKIKKWTPQKR